MNIWDLALYQSNIRRGIARACGLPRYEPPADTEPKYRIFDHLARPFACPECGQNAWEPEGWSDGEPAVFVCDHSADYPGLPCRAVFSVSAADVADYEELV